METAVANPLEGMSWDDVRELICERTELDGEWAGVPLPVEGLKLSVASRFSFQGLNDFSFGKDEEPEESDHPPIKVINSWWCPKRGGIAWLVEIEGKREVIIEREYPPARLSRQLKSYEVTFVQDAFAELTAMQKLAEHIKPHLWKGYVLQGLFLETSEKSHVTYIFRKGKPTVAMRADDGQMRILAVLCLHPIGYYQETFTGAMVPTDEVIANLLLMRADEHEFWKRANQHRSYDWQAGI